MACLPSTSTCCTSAILFFLPSVPILSQKLSLRTSDPGPGLWLTREVFPNDLWLGAGLAAPRGVRDRGKDMLVTVWNIRDDHWDLISQSSLSFTVRVHCHSKCVVIKSRIWSTHKVNEFEAQFYISSKIGSCLQIIFVCQILWRQEAPFWCNENIMMSSFTQDTSFQWLSSQHRS